MHPSTSVVRPPWTALHRIAGRRGDRIVVVPVVEVWAFEARGRMFFAHSARGTLDMDASLKELEFSALGHRFLRVHRCWLASTAHVRELEQRGRVIQLLVGAPVGEGRNGVWVPVARERAHRVRTLLLQGTVGLRRRPTT
jgi:DNA-binding LytR/AlgR family response regulator